MVSNRRRSRVSREAGLTMVELMITLIVASLVASSTFVFFAGQQKVYETQGKMLNMQQNLWGATEVLGRHVRAAGIGMANCVRYDPDQGGPLPADPPPGTQWAADVVPPDAPKTGLRAIMNGTVVRIPPLWVRNGANGGPDMIMVAYGTNTFGNNVDADLRQDVVTNQPFTSPVIVDAGAVFRANEFMLLVDAAAIPTNADWDRGCTLFQVSSVDAATNRLNHIGGMWNPTSDVAGLVPFTYQGGTDPAQGIAGVRNFGQLNWIQFYVVPASAPGVSPVRPPRLWMSRFENNTAGDASVLAEGIEDMQITYGCDIPIPLAVGASPDTPLNGGDGVITEGADAAGRANDEWIFNTPGDVIRPDCHHAAAVRVTLIARSTVEDPELAKAAQDGLRSNYKPGVEDGQPGPVDGYRHRVISTTINPRNRE
jgi:hypothetical protein